MVDAVDDDGSKSTIVPDARRSATSSLSARLLSQAHRLVGCSLPPRSAAQAPRSHARGFVTLSVHHILESAATTQRLPETTLVRVRWRHEASERGSLFQPAKIANAPVRRSASRHSNESESRSSWSVRAVEMVHPICVDALSFLAYLCETRELVLDVIDRSTRRRYGTCTVPLLATGASSPTAALDDSGAAEHRIMAELRRENALYEIKSLDADEQDDVLGYVAVNLDAHFRDLSELHELLQTDGDAVQSNSVVGSAHEPLARPPVLIPRHAAPAIRVQTPAPEPSPVRSPLSYLASDAEHSVLASSSSSHSSRLEPSASPVSSIATSAVDARPSAALDRALRRSKRDRTSLPPPPPPPDLVKLQHLIAKGKALQLSMARATQDGDAWASPNDASDVHDVSAVVTQSAAAAVAIVDDPHSWQAILQDAAPPLELPSDAATHGARVATQSPVRAAGLKIAFDALGFTREFMDELQHLRDATISSRFRPMEIAVSHSDVTALLDVTRRSDSTEARAADDDSLRAPLFTIAPSLRKRACRLSFAHVVALPQTSLLDARAQCSERLLHFRVVCRAQATPRRASTRAASQIVLHGAVAVSELFRDGDIAAQPEPRLVQVSLFRQDERASRGTALRARRAASAPRVGVVKVQFQLCRIDERARRDTMAEPRASRSEALSPERASSSASSNALDSVAASDAEVSEHRSAASSNRPNAFHSVVLAQQQQQMREPARLLLQLAVVISRVTVVALPESWCHEENDTARALFVRFQYAVPHATRSAASSRSLRRKLVRTGACGAHTASVGHVGVFPLALEALRAKDFASSLLIVEVWLQDATHTRANDGAVLGLVKIPFTAFAARFRDQSRDWDRAIPVVGVDDHLPIVDPFSGRTAGFVRMRVAAGTAEQIVALTATARAVVQLQALVRGRLARRAHPRQRPTSLLLPRATASDASAQLAPKAPEHRSDATRANGVATVGAPDDARRDASSQDDTSDQRMESPSTSDVWASRSSDTDVSDTSLYHELRLEIRACCLASTSAPRSEQRPLWRDSASVLGCEVRGELLERPDQSVDAHVVAFALWWDARHAQLNSSFEHTTRARRRTDATTASAAVDSVRFTFHAQSDFTLSDAAADGRQGRARLDIAALLLRLEPAGSRVVPASTAAGRVVRVLETDVDVPITWHAAESQLCSVFPLRIRYLVTAAGRVASPLRLLSPLPLSIEASAVETSPSRVAAEDDELDSATSATADEAVESDVRGGAASDAVALSTPVSRPDARSVESQASDTPAFLSPSLELPRHDDLLRDARSPQELGHVRSRASSTSSSCASTEAKVDVAVADELTQSLHDSVASSSSSRREAGDSVFAYFEPLTLASLGIDELELSPVSEPARASPLRVATPDHEAQDARVDRPDVLLATAAADASNSAMSGDASEATAHSAALRASFFAVDDDDESDSAGGDGDVLQTGTADATALDLASDGCSGDEASRENEEDTDDDVRHEAQSLVAEDLDDCASRDANAADVSDASDSGEVHAWSEDEATEEDPVPAFADASAGSLDVDAVDSRDVNDLPVTTPDDAPTCDHDVSRNSNDDRAVLSSCARSDEPSGAETLGSSRDVSEVAVATDAIASHDQATQVTESCFVTSADVAPDDLSEERAEAAEETVACASHTHDDVGHSDTRAAPQGELREALASSETHDVDAVVRMKRPTMVDAACGTSDDLDDALAAIDASRGLEPSSLGAHCQAVASSASTASNTLAPVSMTDTVQEPMAQAAPPTDDQVLTKSSATDAVAVDPKTSCDVPPPPSFSISQDKFELICRLLADIRDSCESSRATRAATDLRARGAAATDECARAADVMQAPTRQEDAVPRERVECPDARDPPDTTASVLHTQLSELEVSGAAHTRSHSIHSDAAAESSCAWREPALAHSAGRSHERRLRPLDWSDSVWSDSATLQREVQRRLSASAASLADDDKRASAPLAASSTASDVRPRAKLFHDNEVALPLVGTRAQHRVASHRSLAFSKADSETERIARIMQGSVNYWRKGDEHAATSDDDSADSDGDSDLFF